MPLDPSSPPTDLVALHLQAAQLADPEAAREMLFASGFVDGMLDGLRAVRAFRALPAHVPALPPRYALQIEQAPRPGEPRLLASLPRSREARLPVPGGGPACLVAAGYGSGWHSALSRTTWLLRETRCASEERGPCRFEGRPVRSWLDLDPDWTRTLLPALRFDRVEEQIEAPSPLQAAGDLELGPDPGLDPMSPALQVWGPVVVLPYGGVREGSTSLDSLLRDPETEEIRVAIIDVTGVRVDGAEALGLARLDWEIRRRGIDVIIAGRRGRRRGELETRDVDRGIALAFQLCTPEPGVGRATG
ncbi:MAG: hypothetical protein ACE5IL_01120 [Myxococcota bacterium]